jgi:hypothetical protein
MAPLLVFVWLFDSLRKSQTIFPPVCFIRYGAFGWSVAKVEQAIS